MKKDKSSRTGETSKKVNPKLLYLCLLEAALRYREAYFRDDIELFERQIESYRKPAMTFSQKKSFDKLKTGKVLSLRTSMEKFNTAAYKEVENIIGQLPPPLQEVFDEFSTGFALLSEEFLIANDKGDLLAVCKAYNSGKFDEAIASLKEKVKFTEGGNEIEKV